jgi:pimeloyl-ACP methyl ester carboxylesterase
LINFKKIVQSPDAEWITFIHGAGGSSTIWFKQLKFFSKYFNLLLIDLRGHGISKDVEDKVNTEYTFQAIGDDVIEVLDYLNITKTHMIGISLGTIVIRELSERYPERIESLILGGAVMKMNFRTRSLMSFAKWFKSIIPYMYLYKFFAFIIMPKKNHSESRNLFVNEARKLCQREFKKWIVLFTKLTPILSIFRTYNPKQNTLYIMGSEDYLFLPAIKHLVSSQENSSLYVIPNCGHVVNIEAPNVFNNVVLDFLKKRA